MNRLLAWLVRGECLRHADPLFDRDPLGHAVFRCPRCLATWPILPGLSRRLPPAPPAAIAEWRPAARADRPAARAKTPARPFVKTAA
jgi:hypothetical protein